MEVLGIDPLLNNRWFRERKLSNCKDNSMEFGMFIEGGLFRFPLSLSIYLSMFVFLSGGALCANIIIIK